MQRRWSLLALTLLAFASAYYFYYYDATSVFFTGPSGTLMLMASIFATGFLLSGGFGKHREHGHHHDHHDHHEHAEHGEHYAPGQGHEPHAPKQATLPPAKP